MGEVEELLTLAGTALLGGLAVTLGRRKLYREYRFFFAYIVFAITAQVVGFSASYAAYGVYFDVYWVSEALYAIFALLALYEAFHDVFRTDYEDWPWFKLLFPAAVGILTGFFIADALRHPPMPAGTVATLVISFGKVVNYVKGGLFALFFLVAFLLDERWQRYPFGIVTGFAVSATGSLAGFWAVSVFGTKATLFAHYALPVAYILAVLVWIGTCFQRPDREFRPPRTGIVEALGTAREYRRFFQWITGRR